jgi:hypothetical protein
MLRQHAIQGKLNIEQPQARSLLRCTIYIAKEAISRPDRQHADYCHRDRQLE